MLHENHYCGTCLRTTRFLDLGKYLVCEVCTRRLDRTEVKMRCDYCHLPFHRLEEMVIDGQCVYHNACHSRVARVGKTTITVVTATQERG